MQELQGRASRQSGATCSRQNAARHGRAVRRESVCSPPIPREQGDIHRLLARSLELFRL